MIAGQSLAGARGDRLRLVFGLAPAGVGIWALAWFLSLFDVAAVGTMQAVGSVGGVIAASGFAYDGLISLEPHDRRRGVWAGVITVVVLAAAFVAIAGTLVLEPGLFILGVIPRLVAMALTGLVGFAALARRRSADPELARLGRRVALVFGVASAAFMVFAIGVYFDARTGIDPLLWVVLVAEATALVYVVDRRVEMHLMLSRLLSSALIALLVVGFSLLALWGAGVAVDPGLVASAAAIALFAGLLFVGLGRVLERLLGALLFPGEARLERALELSRGEVAAMRRRLERVERLAIAGELAASVAHEIKNPLAPIRGYAQLLSGKLAGVPAADRPLFEKGLGIIQAEVDRIDGRVKSLLELARGERAPTDPSATAELHRVILDVIAVAEGEPAVREVRRSLDPSIGRVRGDADELRGALSNVLKNAAEAMEPLGGGAIEVSSRREGERAVVEILDEGVGLDPDAKGRAFETFYTTKRGGTGLGLAIGRSAIEATGGSIALFAREDRRGARVRIELPLASAEGGTA